jgi:hypothetical protein
VLSTMASQQPAAGERPRCWRELLSSMDGGFTEGFDPSVLKDQFRRTAPRHRALQPGACHAVWAGLLWRRKCVAAGKIQRPKLSSDRHRSKDICERRAGGDFTKPSS